MYDIGLPQKAASVEAEDELPEINESTVESLSQEVREETHEAVYW